MLERRIDIMKLRIKTGWVICGLAILIFAFLATPPEVVSKELTVVAVMYGHANEGTWDPSAYQGLLGAQKKVPFTLHLNEGTSTQDAEKIIRNWAAKGVDVIFAHSDIYTEQLLKVAQRFKKVHFIGEAQLDPRLHRDNPELSKLVPEKTPPNVLFAGDTPFEGNYLAGYAAALVSKTNTLGVLQPFEAPPLNRYSNSFLFGAQAAKPDIKVKVVYLGDYIAPAETRDAVKTLAQQGCDVVFSEMDDNSAILESAAQGIYSLPMYIDKHNVDSKAVLTSVVMGWGVVLQGAIAAASKGTWADYRKEHYFRGLSVSDGSIYLGTWGTDVPESVKKAVADVKAKIADGTIKVKIVDEKLIQ
jgi:basic membrane lipoprotein Med (substrate-binding protein (PBP1-ABC) superfamily)